MGASLPAILQLLDTLRGLVELFFSPVRPRHLDGHRASLILLVELIKSADSVEIAGEDALPISFFFGGVIDLVEYRLKDRRKVRTSPSRLFEETTATLNVVHSLSTDWNKVM